MSISENPIEIEPYGTDGYKVTGKSNAYSFVITSDRIEWSFKTENSAQVDDLLQVLEGVVELIKTTALKDEMTATFNKEIEKKVKATLAKERQNETENQSIDD